MKIQAKKLMAFLMAIVLITGMFPLSVFAEGNLTTEVESVNAVVGSTFNVKVNLSDNPGIAAYKIMLEYDETLLTLNSVTYNTAMGGTVVDPQTLTSPVTLYWYAGTTNIAYNGVFATLSFTASDEILKATATSLSVSFDEDDITNVNQDTVPMTVQNGAVSILLVKPGDINGDAKTNNKDLVCLAQYLANWDVRVNQGTLDVNGDSKVNNKDLVLLAQFLANWDVIIYPIVTPVECPHQNLTATEAKSATCAATGNIAYWTCSDCGKYFSDAEGENEITLEDTVLAIDPDNHANVVIDEAVAATYTSTGLTEGSHCDACHEVLQEQSVIPMLKKATYSITYNIAGNDEYLASQSINLPTANKTSFTEDDAFYFEDLSCKGYTFKGWYDSYGNAVPCISKGTSRNVTVYAHWEKENYTITFDNSSMGLPSTTRTYTVDENFILDPHDTVDRYVFLGWTTDSDTLVTQITSGTTGNFTLHSNWTSKRNLTKPVSALSDPIIIEDTNEGKILFTYELGQIENVPLYTIKELTSSGGVVTVVSETTSHSIASTEANTVAEAIDHVTTDSTAWTLSTDWNETTHVEDSVLEEHGYDRETGTEIGKTSSSTYTLTTNDYDNTVVKSNEGSVATTTQYDTTETNSRETWESKASLSVSDTESSKYTDSAKVSAEVGASYGPVSAKVGAEMSTSTEITSTSTAGASTDVTVSHENTSNTKTGTDTVTVEDNTKTTTTDKGWNKSESSSSSSSSSFTEYEKQVLSELIANEYTYGESYSQGGSNSAAADWSTSTGESTQYSSTLTYYNSDIETESVSYTIDGEKDGYYRLVRAGIVHVFGVVIYDIATAQYTVATYNVLDDYTYTYIDYSATSATFDDNENGVLPFEIPYSVNEYVNGRIVSSSGLKFNTVTGSTGEYSGSETSVIIPEFISVDNKDNTYSAVTIRNLSSETFKENTELRSVLLSSYIREIPDSAFAGCASLEFVFGSEISKIGSHAFDGCTSLGTFKVPVTVTAIGEDAFKDVDSIEVIASNVDVVKSAIDSGAKNITINISQIVNQMSNVVLEIPDSVETFELIGGRNTFTNLRIQSEAATTILNGITITGCTSAPLVITSENITLNQVSAESSNYVMLLKGTAPVVSLYGSSQLTSNSTNAVVCRNVTFEAIDSNITSELVVTGNVLYYGTINNQSLVKLGSNSEFIELENEDEYNKYLRGFYTISFDAAGGSVSETSRTCNCGSAVGSLPTPSKDYNDFTGWYTSSGVAVDSSYIPNEDVTLYARWSEKAVSSWVLASSVPAGARIVQTSYSYRLSYAANNPSGESGYTRDGYYETYKTSGTNEYVNFKSGFNTGSSYYSKYNITPQGAYETDYERCEVNNVHAGRWIYWHWMYDVAYSGSSNRPISTTKGTYSTTSGSLYFKYFTAIESSIDCSSSSGNYCVGDYDYAFYNGQSLDRTGCDNAGTWRYFREDIYQNNYTIYTKMWQYHCDFTYQSTDPNTINLNGKTLSYRTVWCKYQSK